MLLSKDDSAPTPLAQPLGTLLGLLKPSLLGPPPMTVRRSFVDQSMALMRPVLTSNNSS